MPKVLAARRAPKGGREGAGSLAGAERWREFWAEAPPPGWESVDLSPEDIRKEREAYWQWDEEPELDQ